MDVKTITATWSLTFEWWTSLTSKLLIALASWFMVDQPKSHRDGWLEIEGRDMKVPLAQEDLWDNDFSFFLHVTATMFVRGHSQYQHGLRNKNYRVRSCGLLS